MTQEDKQFLLKDLCARLPYKVKIWNSEFLDSIEKYYYYPNEILTLSNLDYYIKESIEVKPYLRPMSSMTEEEENEWSGFNIDPLLEAVDKPHTRLEDLMLRAKSQYEPLNWLNAHHFDYRGLIEKRLALEAPEGMYKIE